MIFLRWRRLPALGVGLWVLACGGDGGGGTGPCTPGVATQLVKSGDGQTWYVNNPLPAPLSVTARDVNACPVPGVVVDWTIQTGSGGLSTAQSTTNSSGVASTVDSVGATSPQVVRATAAGLPAQDFMATATAPPSSVGVDIVNTAFSPASVVVQASGTVTWTWKDSPIVHNVTYTNAPGTLPASSTTKDAGTFSTTFTQVGTYKYVCTVHGQMNNGVVTVVH